VSDSTKRPTSRCLAELGSYDPRQEPARVKLDVEKVKAWIAKGARPSDTVRSLLGRV
jgi:small subunit ribosomal protein S16